MAVSRLRIRGPRHRHCEIVVSEPDDQPSPARATRIDAPSAAILGSAYRLAAITVDIETNLLGRRSRRVGDMLRSHRLLWRRWNRVRTRHLESDPAPAIQ